MKKFLPLIVFILVFLAALASQVGLQKLTDKAATSIVSSEYKEYETLFLSGTFQTIDGKKIITSQIVAPVVIYNFWASWCLPCLEEMPSMISLKKKYGDNKVQIIAINTDEENQLDNIKKTMKKIGHNSEFIIVPDVGVKIVDQFKITAIPVTIIFHRGRVVHFSNGPMDFNSGEFLEKMNKWILN